FPQYIRIEDGITKLICNVVVMPRTDPFNELVAGEQLTAFAKASFRLKAWLVNGGTDKLPTVQDHSAEADFHVKSDVVFQNTNREKVFNAVKIQFDVDPTPPELFSGKKTVTVKKYLPEAYRNALD